MPWPPEARERMLQQREKGFRFTTAKRHFRDEPCQNSRRRAGQRPAGRIVDVDLPAFQLHRHTAREATVGRDERSDLARCFGGLAKENRDAERLFHQRLVRHDARTLFAGLPQPCEVGRYHSLIAAPSSLPAVLEVSARTAEGEIMAVRHRTLTVEGVQFHPESILTPEGPRILGNFLGYRAGVRPGGDHVAT